MNYFSILALLLVAFFAYASTQCPGIPRDPSCTRPRDVGRGGGSCTRLNMWYFDAGARQCREFTYLGCRGNDNRYCTKADCERICRR